MSCAPLDLYEDSVRQFQPNSTLRVGVEIARKELEGAVTDRCLGLVPQTFDRYRSFRHQLGIRIASASNISELLGSRWDQKFGISDAIDVDVLSSRWHFAKPDPRSYPAAPPIDGCGAEMCGFLDDSRRNVQGVRAAGITVYHVSGVTEVLRPRRAVMRPTPSSGRPC
jgi:FMN phosphatase YigB (HAD superfamily)